jgi:hypothetical protein
LFAFADIFALFNVFKCTDREYVLAYVAGAMTKKKVSKPLELSEAVFLVVCDPSMNELWATYTGLCIYLYGSRLLTASSYKGGT